jgi:(1->4)-alpha-D-glucan 1-alpha-D-glucosylmutase
MKHLPSSTYRLQLHKNFTLDDASAITDYLKQLGITHVYSSPYLQAAPGSTHGYDVVDHRRVNEELGGEAAHERFCKRLGEMGLGQVLDIVPNHMSLGVQNRYWWDVLENGTNSLYASFFDIDWNSSEERLRDKVLVPILPDQYGRVLGAGGIQLTRKGHSFAVETAGQVLPVAPQTLAPLLTKAAEYARNDMLNFLAEGYARLPSLDVTDRRTALARNRDKLVLHRLLQRLCSEEEEVREAVDRTVAELNANFDALDQFLSQQNYRIAFWKTADQQLGYRRFFDVNTMIALRQERDYVFDETHALMIRWLRQGVIDGVRVDHPDGLRDPVQYFRRLREKAPDAWIIGEKILEPGEWLRDDWPVEGTSGYDFLNVALGLLIEPGGLKRLGEFYKEFTGDDRTFSEVVHDKKLAVEQEALGSDVNRLTDLFVDICESHREQRDFTRAEIRRAIREVAGCISVYRTYVVPDRGEIVEEDGRRIDRAIECAKNYRQDIDALLFDFMRDVLELKVTGQQESEFVYRFQQFTGPVMAKGVEDTAFYCHNRLLAMNEVGGDPDGDGVNLRDFHLYNERMQQTFPGTMVTLSTHDTKRSDDVRARLAVLSENPEAFIEAVRRWSDLAARHDPERVIDRPTEWFLYQTLVGAWPINAERLRTYMQKAMREAKVRTSWVMNNAQYEEALNGLIDGLLGDDRFVSCLEQFVAVIQNAGRVNSLTQTLIKHTAPGVPDLYQGGELWDLSLVDPDNRRPVDYELRRKLLTEVASMNVTEVMQRSDEGLPKLWTIHRALGLRNEHPEWFGREAGYEPVLTRGPQAERVIAYLRAGRVLTVAQRWVLRDARWEGTALDLPKGEWRNCLTDERIAQGGEWKVKDLFSKFPVALLVRID